MSDGALNIRGPRVQIEDSVRPSAHRLPQGVQLGCSGNNQSWMLRPLGKKVFSLPIHIFSCSSRMVAPS